MTAGNNDPDDPFAYLYRQEGGEADADGDAAQGRTAAQPGVPRTSYNQVQRVGERRQAPQQQGGGYGYPPQQPQYGQQPPYGQPQHGQQHSYGQQPQAAEAMRQQGGDWDGGRRGQGGGGPQGRGPNSKGLLIGAVAVVAAVAIGIGVAIAGGDNSNDTAAGTGSSPTGADSNLGGSTHDSASPSTSTTAGELPGTMDAATLTLSGGASVADDVKGAKAAGGKYVTGMQTVGATASWTFNAPEKGAYTLYVTYSVPGSDSNSTITVNGEKQSRPLSMKNYAHAPAGDWEKGWTNTYGYINLKQGQNTVAISCEAGNTCDFYLDQFSLKRGQVG